MEKQFSIWLINLKRIWEDRKPLEAPNLCSRVFVWHETPFGRPIETRQELVEEWNSILDQDDIHISCEVINICGNIGVAHWHANFRRISSDEHVEMDGIFQVDMDSDGKCKEFRQWYVSK